MKSMLAVFLLVVIVPNAQAAEYVTCIGTSGKVIYTNLPFMCADEARKAQEATKLSLAENEKKKDEPVKAKGLVTDAVFSASSFWYTPIPKDVPLASNSADLAKELVRQKTQYYGNVTINTSSYASPVYTVDEGTPRIQVTQWDCQKKGYLDSGLKKQWASVPVPSYAKPSAGTDMEMTIYQPSTDTVWEFWKARQVDGQWQACWGGQLEKASKSEGIFPKFYGTTATSLPFLGGQITAEELIRGEIKHAIGISLVDTDHWNMISWPAHRSDGYNPHKIPNRIAEGQRFRLDPSIDVDALKISRTAKIVAKAAQAYGFVVWDRAGSVSLRAQNAMTYTSQGMPSPYPALFDNKPNYAVLNGFPWDRVQFLPMNYGKPGK